MHSQLVSEVVLLHPLIQVAVEVAVAAALANFLLTRAYAVENQAIVVPSARDLKQNAATVEGITCSPCAQRALAQSGGMPLARLHAASSRLTPTAPLWRGCYQSAYSCPRCNGSLCFRCYQWCCCTCAARCATSHAGASANCSPQWCYHC